MELKNSILLQASRETVWKNLHDAEVLRQCIPGCESVEKISETEFKAAVLLKIGPVKAKFKSLVKLADLDFPNSYRISEVSTMGTSGFAKGEVDIRLEEQENGATLLIYEGKGYVGGKLLQMGGRLIESTAQKYTDDFFQTFTALVTGVEVASGVAESGVAVSRVESGVTEEKAAESGVEKNVGSGIWRWILAAVAAAAVALLLLYNNT